MLELFFGQISPQPEVTVTPTAMVQEMTASDRHLGVNPLGSPDAIADVSQGGGWLGESPLTDVSIDDRTALPVTASNTDPLTGTTLDDTEAAELLYMREEEKLARDVYLSLYEQWQLPVFSNIANSEQNHTEAVARSLARYGLEDPITNAAVGEFSDPSLQQLYDELITEGSQSLAAALAVGAKIEEIDIADLETAMANTDNADLDLLYDRLQNGSENHLRAFTGTLSQQTGQTYQPEVLSPEEYDEILGESGDRGGRGQGPGNGRGRR